MSKTHEDASPVVEAPVEDMGAPHDPVALVVDDAALLSEEGVVAPAADDAAATPQADVVAHEVAAYEQPDHAARGGAYPSLYDSKVTTIVAVLLCVGIIAAVQFIIERIFRASKDIHHALTRFVVSMVGLLVAAYLCDLVVSGPDTSLLADAEKTTILDFIRSTALMIFSYFFGVKSAGAPPASSTQSSEEV